MATTPKAATPTVVCDISGKQAHYTVPADKYPEAAGNYAWDCIPTHLGAAAARGEFPLAEPGASEE